MHSHLEQAIKERAHAIWEQDGCPDGKALDHWLRAETEIISSSLYSIPRTSYENFAVECPWCQKESIFNRRSDLQTCDPITGYHRSQRRMPERRVWQVLLGSRRFCQ